MNKIGLIIKREYTTRVRKRSFIIMSILGPILFASLMVVPALIAMSEDQEVKRIAVVDSSHLFMDVIPESEYLKFDYLENARLNDIKRTYSTGGYYGVLYISHIVAFEPNSVVFYSDKQPNLATKMHISRAMENYIRDQKLKTYEIENLDNILKSVKTRINIRTIKITESGREKESHTGVAMAVGYLGGFLIYMFIFFFGAQLMRGVIEEKVNRIVEVIVSSVKPFQLMMGKIIGIAMVGLTQFMIWVVTTFLLVILASTLIFPEMNMSPTEQVISQDIMSSGPVEANPEAEPEAKSEDMDEIMGFLSSLKDINFALTLGSFIFYFLGGYLLYGALFASIGAAVDNETDTQQFMLPLTIPLILALLVLVNTINNPDSSISFWFSIIPFTSPIVMMGRLPFGVPDWEVGLSMALLVITFIGMTWLAAKIYRTGILMYGKKTSYKEIAKWIRHS
jgi:ABC-2 type transport system permease protein